MIVQPSTDEVESLRRLNLLLLAEIRRLKEELDSLSGPERRATVLEFFKQETLHLELELQAATNRSDLLEEELKIQASTKAKASKSKLKGTLTLAEQGHTTSTNGIDVAVQSDIAHGQDACVGTEGTNWWAYNVNVRRWADAECES